MRGEERGEGARAGGGRMSTQHQRQRHSNGTSKAGALTCTLEGLRCLWCKQCLQQQSGRRPHQAVEPPSQPLGTTCLRLTRAFCRNHTSHPPRSLISYPHPHHPPRLPRPTTHVCMARRDAWCTETARSVVCGHQGRATPTLSPRTQRTAHPPSHQQPCTAQPQHRSHPVCTECSL